MATGLLEIDTPIIPLNESRRFITDCMISIGTPRQHAEALGDLLIAADYRGHYSHGMNRLGMYINEAQKGMCDVKALPKIIKETVSTAWVDGQNGLGAVVGKYCMELAITKAKNTGIGFVVAKESNHYGIAGVYALQALKEGLLGMSMTNSSPCMVPTRAKDRALGTNPISLGAPALNGDNFMLDMATTTVAMGKVEIQKRKNKPIPEGWALDQEGNVVTDPNLAYDHYRLTPLGGKEETGSYKGSGLGMMVEVLCGILGGAAYGPNIRNYDKFDRTSNLGHCFLAIDPNCFNPDFKEDMSSLMQSVRKMEPVDENKPVLVAGDPERMHMDAVEKAGGVRYVEDQLISCQEFAQMLKVKPLQPLIN